MNTELIERAIRLAFKPKDCADAAIPLDVYQYVLDASDLIKELYQQMFIDNNRYTEELGKWIGSCNVLMEKLNDK